MNDFGGELRRLLAERGMSTRQVARLVPCDPGYISHLCTGRKRASREMAERLDDILAAGGTLAALAARPQRNAVPGAGALPLLLPSSFLRKARCPELTVEEAEAILGRLYRIDDEFGGDELCGLIAGYLHEAAAVFSQAIGAAGSARMYRVMGGLTQIAGWLSIDASRYGDASRYLAAAVYAAHEIGDLGLAGHVLGYMSLGALYQGRHREALSLAETAIDLTHAAPPSVRAIVHARAARALARDGIGARAACERQLDQAMSSFSEVTPAGTGPQWCGYIDQVELAAQRGACFLDLGLPAEAASALAEAISLLETSAPHRARDLAHYKIRLALAHLRAGDLDTAMDTGADANALLARIASARVRDRFGELVAAVGDRDQRRARELATAARESGTRPVSRAGPPA